MYNQILNIFSKKIKKNEGNLLIKFIYNELDRRGLKSHLSSEIGNNNKINNDNINLLADDLESLKHTVKRFNEKTKILLEDIKKYKEAAIDCYDDEIKLP